MKNFIQPGSTVSVIAAVATIAGAGVRLGVLFGVAVHDAEAGAALEISTEGVFDMDKATGSAWAVGDPVYWNGTAVTRTASAGNLLIGCALSEQVNADEVGAVRLNGSCPAALAS